MKDMTEGKCPFGFGAEGAQGAGEAQAPTADAAKGQTHMVAAKALARDKLPELAREPIEAAADGHATGRCLCGKISFRIESPVEMVFANHDAVSRRRAGGVAMTVMTRASNTVFNGWGHLVHYPLSEYETACFCRVCGTPLLTYYLAPEPINGMAQISAGALDSTEGLRLAADICADEKPDFYAFEGERRDISSDALSNMLAKPHG